MRATVLVFYHFIEPPLGTGMKMENDPSFQIKKKVSRMSSGNLNSASDRYSTLQPVAQFADRLKTQYNIGVYSSHRGHKRKILSQTIKIESED